MKFEVNFAAILLVTSCCFQLCTCVPVATKMEDPCQHEELISIPTCETNDGKCNESNDKTRMKRRTLCEENPGCDFCGTQIFDNSSSEIDEPDIVSPIETPNQKLVERNIIIEHDNETQYYRGYVDSAANITTVIRLTNHIHNENIINMPTTLNNTNVNNIHVYQNHSSVEGGKYGLGYTEKGSCCYYVQPKSCKHSTAGLKCRHRKQRVCGHQCTQKIIHPNRNPCMNIPQWPYRMCSQNNPQYQSGYIPGFNPVFYPPPIYPGFYPPQSPSFTDEFDDSDMNSDDDDLPLFPTDEVLNDSESGWAISPKKCKVISEDGLEISDCTDRDDHPFAKNTVEEPTKKHVRHAYYDAPSTQYQNQMMYQQPAYFQPMPMYMPQYYAPPWPMNNNYYQSSAIPSPFNDFYENDQESEETYSHHLKRKHTKKHHENVMDIDEDLNGEMTM